MGLSTCLALSGILFGAAFYLQRKNGKTLLDPGRVATRFRLAHQILWNKYYLDEVYMACFVMSTRALASFCAAFDRAIIDGIVNLVGWCGWAWSCLVEVFDRIVVDGWFVNGSAQTTAYAGRQLNRTQTGLVRQYLMLTVLGLLIISSVCAYAFYRW
ncbi:MAG: hypothetical protein NTU83_15300, partial [Candidatus Hydrogenedentes bacterium]|nr:hypothetical protein [Candidatus Hydrogenedentota bacterium]